MGGGLLALPPGVLSSCQEADRFPLSGLESACSVFSYTSAPARPFICCTRPVRARMSALKVRVEAHIITLTRFYLFVYIFWAQTGSPASVQFDGFDIKTRSLTELEANVMIF